MNTHDREFLQSPLSHSRSHKVLQPLNDISHSIQLNWHTRSKL